MARWNHGPRNPKLVEKAEKLVHMLKKKFAEQIKKDIEGVQTLAQTRGLMPSKTEEDIDWTGATWKFTEGQYAGQTVTILGSREDEDFGKVWDAELSGGGSTIFCDVNLELDMNPKTRKPYARGACA